jgi:hypothetical protein
MAAVKDVKLAVYDTAAPASSRRRAALTARQGQHHT